MTIRRSTEEVEDDRGHRATGDHDDGHGRRVTTVEEEPHASGLDAERSGEEVVTSSSPGAASIARRLMATLALFCGIGIAVVETLLGFRLAFLLTEANAANGFVDFIYDVTKPLVEPFQGIIANDTLNNGGVFEPATVIAMVVYLLVAVLVIAVILAAASGMGPDRDTLVTSRSRRSERAAHDH
jgi:YGGT family